MIEFLRTIFPVLIGAVIGYFTNYIAIKMLFHPYNEMRIGGHKVPFTPGIIPKNKSRMARAVGNAVSGQLLTADALAQNIKESNIKEKVAEKAAEAVFGSDRTIHELLLHVEGGEHAVENASAKIASVIAERLRETDLQPVVQGVVDAGLKDLYANPLVSMFLTEDVMNSIYIKLTEILDDYIDNNGEEVARNYLRTTLGEFEQNRLKDVLEKAEITPELIRKTVGDAFESAVSKHGSKMMENIDIQGIIERKIDSMQVPELEALLMSVMKQELQAVINLGALIGAVIGAVNIFIK